MILLYRVENRGWGKLSAGYVGDDSREGSGTTGWRKEGGGGGDRKRGGETTGDGGGREGGGNDGRKSDLRRRNGTAESGSKSGEGEADFRGRI